MLQGNTAFWRIWSMAMRIHVFWILSWERECSRKRKRKRMLHTVTPEIALYWDIRFINRLWVKLSKKLSKSVSVFHTKILR